MSMKRPAGNGPPKGRWQQYFFWGVLGVVAIAALAGFLSAGRSATGDRLDYSSFLRLVAADKVGRVALDELSGNIAVESRDGTTFYVQGRPGGIPEADVALLNEHGVQREYKARRGGGLGQLFVWLLPVGLLIGFFVWMSRRAEGQMAQVNSMGRSKAKVYTTERPSTTFADVAGYAPVKEEITEVIDFLRRPAKFKEIGARIPKGVLLVGPPGTGKTLLARAVAGEASVPFISVSGSQFTEMFVGVGAARVRDLFQTARKQAPAIIFVDEMDSIGRRRGFSLGGGQDEREQTLNQMLSEMDGFEAAEGVVMIAATNRPDILDPALMRPGRFDRQIMVPLPTLVERRAILHVHIQDKKLAKEIDLDLVARGTPGMSGADLANLVNEAALFAVRRGVEAVEAVDFDMARDRVLMGLRRDSMVLSEKDKEVVAFHEGGHAVLAHLLEHADPLHKVTILPTGMALGVTQQMPLEDKHIHQRAYIVDTLAVRLGGRVAETLIYNEYSTGANNDLVGATQTARRMVREWGMSSRIGPLAWGSQGPNFMGDEMGGAPREYSERTAQIVDEEVECLMREQEERAYAVLELHRTGLEAVASALLDKETLTGAEVGHLLDAAAGHPRQVPALTHSRPDAKGNGDVGRRTSEGPA